MFALATRYILRPRTLLSRPSATMPGALLSASAHTTATQKPFSNLLVVSWGAVGDDLRARLTPYFETIEVAAWRAAPTDDQLAAAEVILGLPRAKDIQHRAQVPKLKFVQLISAGSDHIINSPLWKEEGAESIKLATAAGVHTGPIPQVSKATASWESRADWDMVSVLYCHDAGVVP